MTGKELYAIDNLLHHIEQLANSASINQEAEKEGTNQHSYFKGVADAYYESRRLLASLIGRFNK